MGYHVEIVDSKIYLRSFYFKDACESLKKTGFLEQSDKMTGSRYENSKCVERFYAGVNMTDLTNCIEAGDLPGVFRCFRFDVKLDSSGDIVDIGYCGKSGDQEHFLACICQEFNEGDYIQWRGEDGEMWRYLFSNTWMYIQNPITVWSCVDVIKKGFFQ